MARLTRLVLADFRNYEAADVAFGAGPTILVGPNAQGKTNLVEALHYLAVGRSHRVATDAPLVRDGAEAGIVRAVVGADDGRERRVELEIRPRGRNRVRVDGQARERLRDAFGVVRAVLFAPEDLGLVRGDPSQRRTFLDDVLGQRRPAYLAARQDYERTLRQRNTLLKDTRTRGGAPDPSLEAWTEALAHSGATVLAARIAAVHALATPTAQAYRTLVAGDAGTEDPALSASPEAHLSYHLSTGRVVRADASEGVPDPGALAEELRDGFAERAREELDRATTLVGPHRDDLVLHVGDLPAKGYASHGESWSLALALRLASREMLHEIGDEPIVLLDDVFAELDTRRRTRLAELCRGFEQVIVTTAVDEDVPLGGARYQVRAGAITPPQASPAGREAS